MLLQRQEVKSIALQSIKINGLPEFRTAHFTCYKLVLFYFLFDYNFLNSHFIISRSFNKVEPCCQVRNIHGECLCVRSSNKVPKQCRSSSEKVLQQFPKVAKKHVPQTFPNNYPKSSKTNLKKYQKDKKLQKVIKRVLKTN